MARFRNNRVRAPRKTKEWITFYTFRATPTVPGTVAIGTNTYFADWIIDPASAIDFFDEPTVMRFLLTYSAASDSFVSDNRNLINMGIIVTRPTDSATQGVPLFDPLVDGYWDWLWTYTHQYISAPSVGASAIADRNVVGQFDIRSRRKIEPGEGVLFVATVPGGGNASAMTLMMSGRMLLAHA